MKTILALDLGTTTGFAIGGKGHVVSGTWGLKPSRYDGGGMRFVKFRAKLEEIHRASPFDMVFYEEVRRHAATDAAHVYGGLMGHLTEWCETREIPYEGVPVGSIKKAWSGKGNADKAMMIAEAKKRGFTVVDDNEADALALFYLKIAEIGEDSNEQPVEQQAEPVKELVAA